jgi:hypothetical protein
VGATVASAALHHAATRAATLVNTTFGLGQNGPLHPCRRSWQSGWAAFAAAIGGAHLGPLPHDELSHLALVAAVDDAKQVDGGAAGGRRQLHVRRREVVGVAAAWLGLPAGALGQVGSLLRGGGAVQGARRGATHVWRGVVRPGRSLPSR